MAIRESSGKNEFHKRRNKKFFTRLEASSKCLSFIQRTWIDLDLSMTIDPSNISQRLNTNHFFCSTNIRTYKDNASINYEAQNNYYDNQSQQL